MKNIDAVAVAYEAIKNKIFSKQLFPGSWIVEDAISRETGVSRTSIRAALLKLKFDGFIDIHKNRGAFVAQPQYDEICNIYKVRHCLERLAFESAVAGFSERGVIRMEHNFDAQKELKKNFSISEYAILNREFHWIVIEEAHNPYIEKYLNELYNKVQMIMIFYDASSDNSGSLTTHAKMLDAVKARNTQAALKALDLDNDVALHDISLLARKE